MKKALSILLILIGLPFLQGCFTTTSEATILKDGSGTLVTYIDMSRIFEYYEKMGLDLKDSGVAEVLGDLFRDSIIYYKDKLKEIESLTTDEKEVYENTTVQTRANPEKRSFNYTITSKFLKITQLPIAIGLIKDVLDEKTTTGKAHGEQVIDKEIDLLKNDKKDGMSYNMKNGLIEYAYDENKDSRPDKERDTSGMTQSFDQYKTMYGGIPVKMIFNLPRPAKSVTGKAKTEISPNKKKITISYDMLESLVNPSIQSYRIEY